MSTTQHSDWRIEFDFDRSGSHHMQRDEELLLNPAGPILRLYTWNPPAISLGFQQRMDAIDAEACTRLGIDVVRRPTGGRAVLHWNELTYAVIFAGNATDGIYAVHNRIVAALLDSIATIGPEGHELVLTDGKSDANIRETYAGSTPTNIACFASTARHEATYHGRKIIGSAQRRIGNTVLQHGSILLSNEHQRLPELLQLPASVRERMKTTLENETSTLHEVFHRSISAAEVAGAIATNFSEAWQRRIQSQRMILNPAP